MTTATSTAVTVRTLLCRRDLPIAIPALRSLVQCSADPVRLVLHDDGSLVPEDAVRLQSEFPGARVLWRREADDRMRSVLAAHATAAAFRRSSVWGLKLLDVALAEPGDCFYVDGDIRFFRPFQGLFCRAAVAGRSVFLRDTVWAAYSVRPWHLGGRRRLKVAEAINTGLTLIDRTLYDLDFVDWFLSQPDWRVIPAWVEPTCWAALALRSNGHAVDPGQLTNLYPSARITGRTLGAHFLSAHRRHFRGAFEAPLSAEVLAAEPVPVRFFPLRPLGPVGLFANQVKRKIGNELARRRSPR